MKELSTLIEILSFKQERALANQIYEAADYFSARYCEGLITIYAHVAHAKLKDKKPLGF